MLQAREEDLDRITELLHRILQGEIPQPLTLPADFPNNEVRQVFDYANRFLADYRALAGTMSAMSRGDLDVAVPPGRMHILQSLKNLHANLRHLTWKTQQIAAGDLTQHVDFMGDFSKAFNSMTRQLQEAFARIDRQNHDLAAANLRMKRDLDAAARVQRTLLPQSLPEIEGYCFAWSYRPCDELAGDALNIVRLSDDLVALYLLDVSGHGVPAALLSVTATRSLQPAPGTAASLVSGAGPNPQPVGPAQVVTKLNTLYPMASNGNHYFTMIYALLDLPNRRLRFTVAGHPAPILARPGADPKPLVASGFPVGIVDEADYEEITLDLVPGDRLYLYSDGLTEEINAQDEEFGEPRLLAAIAAAQPLALNDAVESLVQQVLALRGQDHLKDDLSILALSVT